MNAPGPRTFVSRKGRVMRQPSKIAVACVLMLGSTAGAHAAEETFLTIDVAASPASVDLYEPVVLTYTVRNPTENTISSVSSVPADSEGLKATISDAEGKSVKYDSLVRINARRGKTAYSPGAARTANLIMLWNPANRSLAFPKAGRYSVTIEFLVAHFPKPYWIVADPVAIEVRMPSQANQKVIEYFGSESALVKAIVDGPRKHCSDTTPACLEEFRQAARLYPEASYSPFLCFRLVEGLSAGVFDVPTERELAREVAEECVAGWPQHPASLLASRWLIRHLLEEGETEEALARIEEFERLWPERPRVAAKLRERLGAVQ